jgi:hypothetical protein
MIDDGSQPSLVLPNVTACPCTLCKGQAITVFEVPNPGFRRVPRLHAAILCRECVPVCTLTQACRMECNGIGPRNRCIPYGKPTRFPGQKNMEKRGARKPSYDFYYSTFRKLPENTSTMPRIE